MDCLLLGEALSVSYEEWHQVIPGRDASQHCEFSRVAFPLLCPQHPSLFHVSLSIVQIKSKGVSVGVQICILSFYQQGLAPSRLTDLQVSGMGPEGWSIVVDIR